MVERERERRGIYIHSSLCLSYDRWSSSLDKLSFASGWPPHVVVIVVVVVAGELPYLFGTGFKWTANTRGGPTSRNRAQRRNLRIHYICICTYTHTYIYTMYIHIHISIYVFRNRMCIWLCQKEHIHKLSKSKYKKPSSHFTRGIDILSERKFEYFEILRGFLIVNAP